LKELGGATGLTASATTASSYSKMYHRCASLPARSTQRAEPRARLLVAAAGLALARQYDAAGTHTSGRRRTHPAAAGLKGAATGANARAQRRRPDAEQQPVARHPSPGWTSASGLISNVGDLALPRSGLRRDAAARSRAQRSGSGREEGGDGKGAARLPYPAVGYPENKRERGKRASK